MMSPAEARQRLMERVSGRDGVTITVREYLAGEGRVAHEYTAWVPCVLGLQIIATETGYTFLSCHYLD